ncbi:MAG: hypothetical protein JO317_07995 [Verrucomicrobiae bacterium]|nr:hypothetical protein [Verrucomicrobiae bacterium]
MNSIIEKLLVIQDRDSRLNKLEAEKARVPLEIQNLQARIQQARSKVDASKESAKKCEKEQKNLAGEVEAKEGTLNKFKTQLLGIKNNDEFHALQHEIAAVEKEIRLREDRELELMEQIEQLRKETKAEEAACAKVVGQLEGQIAELQKRAQLVEQQIAEVRKSRQELASDVDASALDRYERIMKSKKDAAIVAIQHGTCQGCHMKLTTQVVHDVRAQNNLVQCVNCARILYWNPETSE